MENKRMVERLLGGDLEAFSEMVEKFQNALYSAAYNVIGDFHQAQDIVQEAFIKAYTHMASLKNPEQLGSWLYSIAYRMSLNALRSKRHHETIDSYPQLADGYVLEEDVLKKNERKRVWEALVTLDDKSRSAITLHYIGGLTAKQIAPLLGASPSAIESRIRRSKQQLKKELLMMEEVFTQEKLDTSFKMSVLNKIIAKPPFQLAGYRVEAPFAELGKGVRAAVRQIKSNSQLPPQAAKQDIICLIPPQTFDPQLHVLFVGIEASGNFSLPEGMESIAVPQQKYAVSTYKGTLDQYQDFFRSLPGVIATEGYEPLDMWKSYCFEVYPDKTYHWSNDNALQEIVQHWAVK